MTGDSNVGSYNSLLHSFVGVAMGSAFGVEWVGVVGYRIQLAKAWWTRPCSFGVSSRYSYSDPSRQGYPLGLPLLARRLAVLLLQVRLHSLCVRRHDEAAGPDGVK